MGMWLLNICTDAEIEPTHPPGYCKEYRYVKEWNGLLTWGCVAKRLSLKVNLAISKKSPALSLSLSLVGFYLSSNVCTYILIQISSYVVNIVSPTLVSSFHIIPHAFIRGQTYRQRKKRNPTTLLFDKANNFFKTWSNLFDPHPTTQQSNVNLVFNLQLPKRPNIGQWITLKMHQRYLPHSSRGDEGIFSEPNKLCIEWHLPCPNWNKPTPPPPKKKKKRKREKNTKSFSTYMLGDMDTN